MLLFKDKLNEKLRIVIKLRQREKTISPTDIPQWLSVSLICIIFIECS